MPHLIHMTLWMRTRHMQLWFTIPTVRWITPSPQSLEFRFAGNGNDRWIEAVVSIDDHVANCRSRLYIQSSVIDFFNDLIADLC